MVREQLSAFSVTLAVALALLVPILGGILVQDYSQTEQYISELGAVGTEWGALVSFAGFLPIGIFVLLFLIANAPMVNAQGGAKVGYFMLSGISIGYVVAAFAPCDIGCPAEGTLRQTIHNSVGVVEYIVSSLGLLLFAIKYRDKKFTAAYRLMLLVAGIVVLISFVAMASPNLVMWRGLLQRVAEMCLFGSLVVVWRFSSKH